MIASRIPHLIRIALAAMVVAAATLPTSARASTASQTAGLARVAGSYVATHLSGASVVRLELSLERDGRARLKTGSSRYSQRPTGVDNASLVETGTWRLVAGKVVLHIEQASSAGDDGKDQPVFADRMFVLTKCELRLVGSALSFDKQHCS